MAKAFKGIENFNLKTEIDVGVDEKESLELNVDVIFLDEEVFDEPMEIVGRVAEFLIINLDKEYFDSSSILVSSDSDGDMLRLHVNYTDTKEGTISSVPKEQQGYTTQIVDRVLSSLVN